MADPSTASLTSDIPAYDRDRLVALIRARSYREGEFKLASGRTSRFYINMKPTMMHPEGAYQIARGICDLVADDNPAFIGGLEMGAVPIAAAIAPVSLLLGRPVGTFFIRKQAKEYGTRALVEGLSDDDVIEGATAVVIEDVTTTGGSAMKAVSALRGAGASVAALVTVVDRKEGAADAFAAAEIPFRALLTIEDLSGS
ncbi:MAG: orotate phosphoribosyltransferase [Pseudomonadota bacterium]